ncbi:C-type lectin domain family 2 member F-like isoform X2 [Camelus ferus]|uniref:C-type lectin domain family 2 member F-like isoform X2 n=1 Tax=Camelus ferus TaxID=419612 RepID=A0A8B8SFF2_CAMFR|nr:C-type lectin domain family 2 member F-like isoform X2 [Camelus ferus]
MLTRCFLSASQGDAFGIQAATCSSSLMPEGDMDNQRRLMNAGDSQSSGDVISSNLTIESHEPPKGNKKKPCVSKIIAIIIFLVILIITLAIVLAVEKHKSSMEHVSCLDGWIGYLGKCFYFSENTTTWAASQNFCAAHAANPAVFNTTEELVENNWNWRMCLSTPNWD